jgi:hypothetical protein
MVFDPPIYTLRDFQKSHNLSFLQFHKLRELGLGPRTILIGDRSYVTRESACEWRSMIERYADEHGGKIDLECLQAAPARQEVCHE